MKDPIDIEIDKIFAMIVGKQSEPGVVGAASVIIGHLATAETRFATEHMREWLLRDNVAGDVKRAAKRRYLSPTEPPQLPQPETLAA